jgi:hypothetical protein
VYLLTALLSGIGVGLFMDEVGKFITQSNDYFYPPAAPIIYAFFLLTVLLYVRIRRKRSLDPRQQLYEVLEEIEEILDHDLDEQEKADLAGKLQRISQESSQPDLQHLAAALLNYVESGSLQVLPDRMTFLEKINAKARAWEEKYLRRPVLRAVLIGGMAALGAFSLVRFIPLAAAAFGYENQALQRRLEALLRSGLLSSSGNLDWFSAWLALEGSIGLLLILSAVLLAFGAERRGANLGYLSLLLSLTVVDLLLFYFDQFSSIISALVQFLLLLGVLYYRRRFLTSPS